jgi:hypothetical protein
MMVRGGIKRKERLVEMLEVRDRVYNILEEGLNIRFSEWFNDLYKVKNGEVRRLKGTFYNKVEEGISVIDEDKFDEVFNKIKLMIDGIWINGYKVEFKLKRRYDGCNWGREECCIIKIIWYKDGEKFGYVK